ncbi:Uncharacterised protein [Escherichia coli]|uniref:Uncharacterized protein n=1 Tax=Escherichia coli TaxID=562 RepID=A0A377A214_ECOLX|nr:Uncharacterised protein [Escherichia coli]
MRAFTEVRVSNKIYDAHFDLLGRHAYQVK